MILLMSIEIQTSLFRLNSNEFVDQIRYPEAMLRKINRQESKLADKCEQKLQIFDYIREQPGMKFNTFISSHQIKTINWV